MHKRLTPDDMYYKILKDYQIFVQKCYSINSADEMDEVIKIVGDIFYKYKKTEFYDFVIDLINAHLKDIDRRFKNEHMSNM